MRKEFKYGIGGLIFGFFFCLCLFLLVVSVSASELDELPESQEAETVQDEQSEMEESVTTPSDPERIAAEPPRQESEIAISVVQDEQIDLIAMIPAEQLEILESLAQDLESSEPEPQIELFASGVIVGELADLLQENMIDNDGYTEESWQRYENAVASGWETISNFMTYTNDEVRAVIDELHAAISGLEYPAGKPILPDFESDSGIIAVGLFSVVGSSAGLAFVNKWQLGI